MKWVKIEYKLIESIVKKYMEKVREYNSLISGRGYYLKPIHMVYKTSGEVKKKYIYHGRYWWRIEYLGRSGGKPRIKWIYLGKDKPQGLPDPPKDPLLGLTYYKVLGDDNYVYVPLKHIARLQMLSKKRLSSI